MTVMHSDTPEPHNPSKLESGPGVVLQKKSTGALVYVSEKVEKQRH